MNINNRESRQLMKKAIISGLKFLQTWGYSYLGVTITKDLKWNTHISNVCTKASRNLDFLRRNLFSCPKVVREAVYKRLVRHILGIAQFGILIT